MISCKLFYIALCAAACLLTHTNNVQATDEAYDLEIDDDQVEIFIDHFQVDFGDDHTTGEDIIQKLNVAAAKWNKKPDRAFNLTIDSFFLVGDDSSNNDDSDGNLRGRRRRLNPFGGIGTIGNCTGRALSIKGDDATGDDNAPVSRTKVDLALMAAANARVTIQNMNNILQRNSDLDDDDAVKIRDIRRAIRDAGDDVDKVEELKAKMQGLYAARDQTKASRKHRKRQLRKAQQVIAKADRILARHPGASDLALRLKQLEADAVKANALNSDASGKV